MSPLSPAVLGGAAVVASPALWSGLVDGTMPLDVALTRYLIAIGICWVVISVVAELAFPAPGSVRPTPVEVEAQVESESDPPR
ncbi:MAG: hypothetical protein ACJ72O_01885 [Marmoricola sp.]